MTRPAVVFIDRSDRDAMIQLRDHLSEIIGPPEPEPVPEQRFYVEVLADLHHSIVYDREDIDEVAVFHRGDHWDRARAYANAMNFQAEFGVKVFDAATPMTTAPADAEWRTTNVDTTLAEALGAPVNGEVRDTTPPFHAQHYRFNDISFVYADFNGTRVATFEGPNHEQNAEDFKRVLIQRHHDDG